MRLQLPCPDSVPSGFVRATPAQKRWLCRAYAGDIKWSRSTNPAWTCGGNRYHRQGEDIPMQALTPRPGRSEEHTSELQSQSNLVCRLLLENNKEISRAKRSRQRFAVLFIDLDNFKNVNDTLSLAIADPLLVAIGTRVQSSLRDAHTVARLD